MSVFIVWIIYYWSLFHSPSACDGNFTNSSGLMFSPRYPGYYPPLIRCRWLIKVSSERTIKLRFLEFQLEDHPSCYNDYIEVYDGGTSRTLLGRYCGQRFPEFLQSSSNVMEIIFVSDEKITRAGLKLYYTSEKGKWCIKFMTAENAL